tara:strand:+ start:18633 stop:19298 length:666 start_codon:yes stop_codon:yes gene_type:complete
MTWQLHSTEQRLELTHPEHNPFYLDFSEGKLAHRFQQGIGKSEPLAKAIGVKKNNIPTVLDVTAGMGRDAFVIACCGCQVTLLERSSVLVSLLQDAMQRARQDENLTPIIERMQLIEADSIQYLNQLTEKPDVIYLDPMYPDRKKSALVKKEMRIIRELVGNDQDVESLFNAALEKAEKRVVVKRPKLAGFIGDKEPTHQITGKTTRFDVYLIPSPREGCC